jgi:protein-S-isoprenylcysteine O-methyltransferase Ste14
MSRIAVQAVIFTFFAPGFVTVAAPAAVVAIWGLRPMGLHPAAAWAGAGLIGAGAILYLGCVAAFVRQGKGTPAIWFTRALRRLIGEEPKHIVTGAAYGYVRNPMYVALIAVLAGEALLFDSASLLVFAAVTAVCFHLVVVYLEEPHLRRRDGAAYDEYRRRVPRWLPRFRRE